MSYMLDEIRQAPKVIEGLLTEGTRDISAAAALIAQTQPRWIAIAARGTSDHAAIYARYLIESVLGVPVMLVAPSITSIYQSRMSWAGGLLISISQAGQSPDLLAVIHAAKQGGSQTIAFTNTPSSPLAEASDVVVDIRAGTEYAVAATKTYVASLTAIAAVVGRLRSTPCLETAPLPAIVDRTLEVATNWMLDSGVVAAVSESREMITIGRGYNYATALEVALKLIETTVRFAVGYSAADFEHGPVILADQNTPVLFFESPGPMGATTNPLRQRLDAAGADVFTVTGSKRRPDGKTLTLPLPVSDQLSPIPMVLPGLLLAEAASTLIGYDPDSPKGLSKVTQTL